MHCSLAALQPRRKHKSYQYAGNASHGSEIHRPAGGHPDARTIALGSVHLYVSERLVAKSFPGHSLFFICE